MNVVINISKLQPNNNCINYCENRTKSPSIVQNLTVFKCLFYMTNLLHFELNRPVAVVLDEYTVLKIQEFHSLQIYLQAVAHNKNIAVESYEILLVIVCTVEESK